MSEWGKLLKLVRRYTGDAFTPAHGYDLRKPLNFGQRMAILKYANKIAELTAANHVLYRPKRGEKTEAFSFTNQSGWRKFDVAIVHSPDVKAELKFSIDKSRPKGSRFVAENKKTGQRFYHVPAKVFLAWDQDNPPRQIIIEEDEDGNEVEVEGEDLSETEFYRQVLEDYAQDAEFFLIEAGESYMWGAGGGHDQVANKIQQIIQNYGTSMFSANDPNSSHYRNWFRGVKGWTNRFDVFPAVGQAIRKRRERAEKYNLPTDGSKYRKLKDGSIGHFQNGLLVNRFWLDEY